MSERGMSSKQMKILLIAAIVALSSPVLHADDCMKAVREANRAQIAVCKQKTATERKDCITAAERAFQDGKKACKEKKTG